MNQKKKSDNWVKVTKSHINRGTPNDANCCPVALALNEKFPDYEAEVDDDMICIHPKYSYGVTNFKPLAKINKFIRDFDAGKKVKPFEFVLRKLK